MITINAPFTGSSIDYLAALLRANAKDSTRQGIVVHSREKPTGMHLTETGPNKYETHNGMAWIVCPTLPANLLIVEAFEQTGAICAG